MSTSGHNSQSLTVAIIAGESSGDQLGALLIRRMREQSAIPINFMGVGGPLMEAEGHKSLFPMSDIAVNGVVPVIKRLPSLLRSIDQAAKGVAAAKPDIVVHIDAQDFNKRVAGKLKAVAPNIPLIGYVSPTVWAWRPGRARKIAPLFKKLLAVLPFEPEAHKRLGGPETVYVGHPLLEKVEAFTATKEEKQRAASEPYTLLLLPGSRNSETSRLLPAFGEMVAELAKRMPDVRLVIPAVPHLLAQIEQAVASWPIKPEIVLGEEAKWRAFRTARAALAASGTVTLELALARVPTVLVYRVSPIEAAAGKVLIKIPYVALPSLILERKLIPEFLQHWTTAEITDSVVALLKDGPFREAQLSGFDEVRRIMSEGIESPSRRAAEIILEQIESTKKGA
ncbi:MAG: lipid-A-disaccharide synthase [Beijerinckiaceae bacterium]